MVTVGRSDFSILRPLCQMLNDDTSFDLSLWVGGAHTDPAGGITICDVEASGLPIGGRVAADSFIHDAAGTTAGMAAQVAGIGRCAQAAIDAGARPDLVVILGDRFEAIAAGLAVVPFGLPLLHVSGGSITEGAMDDMFRHALTKLAALHVCDVPEFARRIQQMGEEPWRILTTGALGLDGIRCHSIRSMDDLVREFGLTGLAPGYILATLHPETARRNATPTLIAETLAALAAQPLPVLWTYPNADPGADLIIAAITDAAGHAPDRIRLVRNFGFRWFYSAMAHAGMVVGNSSSGIYEAASFALPVVDIGDRQAGRFRGGNVLHARADRADIDRALAEAARLAVRLGRDNVYGDGFASDRVMASLHRLDWDRITQPKRFAPVDDGFTGSRIDL